MATIRMGENSILLKSRIWTALEDSPAYLKTQNQEKWKKCFEKGLGTHYYMQQQVIYFMDKNKGLTYETA